MKLKRENSKFYNVIFALLLVVIIAIIVFTVNSLGKYDVSQYVTVSFEGLEGFAKPAVQIDKEGLYAKLTENEKDAAMEEYIREFVDSIGVTFSKESGLSNGDSVKVTVTYDKDLAKKAKRSLKKTSFSKKVSGLEQGQNIDIFENVDVMIAGVSPEAYATVSNKWSDEFLNTVTFSLSNANGLSQGDVVVVQCNTTLDEFMEHGFTVSNMTKEYKVDQVNSYVSSVDDLDKSLLTTIRDEALDTIKSETESLSFRMLYKATQDSTYLFEYNTETVKSSELVKAYFLKKKENVATGSNNYIYLLMKAQISNGDATEEVYFAFEYPDGILNADGTFVIAHNDEASRYVCGISYDDILNSTVTAKQDQFITTEITIIQ